MGYVIVNNKINKKQQIVEKILGAKDRTASINKVGFGFAPSNIALCKYWGKRDSEINLPVTGSLSISLADRGAATKIQVSPENLGIDEIILNGKLCDFTGEFHIKVVKFLNLFRESEKQNFIVRTDVNLPIKAGLASSACGFAALVLALNDLFDWNLDEQELSILARMGSGSASRSLNHGFVEWLRGNDELGFDSFAKKLDHIWDDFRIGLVVLSTDEKDIGSREAMQISVDTSPFYKLWPEYVADSINKIKLALESKNFKLLGQIAEQNAIAMHALMQTSIPPVMYSTEDTVKMMKRVWKLRDNGVDVFFTQDAGPNLKLLFLKKDIDIIREYFSGVDIIAPFEFSKEQYEEQSVNDRASNFS